MAREYRSAGAGEKRCPVCAREKYCRVHVSGEQCWCSKRLNPAPSGWSIVVRGEKHQKRVRFIGPGDQAVHGVKDEHWLYVRDGTVMRETSPEELDKQRKQRLADDRRSVEYAQRVWGWVERGQGHRAVLDYLAGRGVPVERLARSVAVRENLRFGPAVEFYEDAPPGMVDAKGKAVARVKRREPAICCGMRAGRSGLAPEEMRGEITCIQRIYVEEDGEGGWRKSRGVGDAKKMLGRAYDGACWLSYELVDGVLCVCEGVETAAAVYAATGYMTVAAMSTSGIRNFRPAPKLLARLRAVVYCGDHDRSGDGGTAARMAANEARGGGGWLKETGVGVGVVLPDSPERAGSLVRAEADEAGVHQPADENAKGVDWLDVVAAGEEGLERVRRVVMAAAEEAAGEGLGVEGDAGGSDAGGGGGGGEPPTSDGSGEAWGEDDEAGDDACGGGPVADYDELDAQVLGDWAIPVRDNGWLILPPDDSLRAVCVLRDLFALRDTVTGRIVGWRLRWFGGRWFVRSTRRPIYRGAEDKELHADIARHLNRYKRHKRVKGQARPEIVPAAFTTRNAAQVLDAMIAYVRVKAESMPCWIRPDVMRDGVMRLMRPMDYDPRPPRGPVDPLMAVTFPDGILDGRAWIDGKFVLHRPDACWFAGSCVPWKLPIEEIERIGAGNTDALVTLCEDHAPVHFKFLREVFGEGDGGLQRTLLWQRFNGLCFIADTSWQIALMVIGPPGSGKGTLGELATQSVGPDSAYSTSMSSVGTQFGISACMGRSLVMIPEIHMGTHTNDALGLERLKRWIGEDELELEFKGVNITQSVRMTAKLLSTPNEAPKFRDASAGIMRRFRIIKLSETFVGREDMDLKVKLKAEMPYIVLWHLLGLRDLYLDKREVGKLALAQPSVDQWAVDAMERGVAPLKGFIADRLVVGKGHRCAKSVMYEVYKSWVKDNGTGEMQTSTFASALYAASGIIQDTRLTKQGVQYSCFTNVRPRRVREQHGQECEVMDVLSMQDLVDRSLHDVPV